MKIITGLGNPGIRYAGTRHNMGFSVVTGLSDAFGIPMNKKECKAITGHGFIAGEKVVLAMPQTYMNLSGEAVSELLHFYKCETSDLIIIYDDVDLDVGKIRIRQKGSAGGHNGIKSIIQCIGSDQFDRIKVGVGSRPEEGNMVDHVLGRFPREQMPEIRDAVDRAVHAAEEIVVAGAASAMNKFN
ncbi:MAG: aminoacyl-tRNA hydrolase [Eubacterium sp.]|nr:aminoacyl-tRNA hydrolase [Eubacterium sp.]